MISAVGASQLDRTATSLRVPPARALGLGAQAARGGGGLAALGAQGPDAATGVRAHGRRRGGASSRQLDGQHRSPELITDAEARFGPGGATRLARLLADLGERGLLEGVEGEASVDGGAAGSPRLSSRASSRSHGLGRLFERVYRAGGWILFTRAALLIMAARRRAGLLAFAYLIVAATGRRSWSPTADRHRGARLPVRPLPRRGAPRARARARRQLVRPARLARRAEADARLPVRVRRHLGRRGSSRAGGASRSARPGPASDLARRRAPSRSAPLFVPRGRSATSSSSSRSRRTSARSPTSTRCSTATATTCSSTGSASPGCASAPGRTWPRCSRAAGAPSTSPGRCSSMPLRGLRGRGRCGIRHSDVDALLRSSDFAGSAGGGVGRVRRLLPADVRPGARDGGQAAARALTARPGSEGVVA